jgi:hypothetical protein
MVSFLETETFPEAKALKKCRIIPIPEKHKAE